MRYIERDDMDMIGGEALKNQRVLRRLKCEANVTLSPASQRHLVPRRVVHAAVHVNFRLFAGSQRLVHFVRFFFIKFSPLDSMRFF